VLGVGLTTLSCKKKIVEKPPRNSAGFCGGGQGLSWAVEPRKEKKERRGMNKTSGVCKITKKEFAELVEYTSTFCLTLRHLLEYMVFCPPHDWFFSESHNRSVAPDRITVITSIFQTPTK
jgi:hypothetical protein